MKKITAICVSSALAMGLSAAWAATEEFDLDDFEAVKVSAGIDAVVTVAENYSVVVEGDEKDLERLRVRVKDGELRVGRESQGIRWGRTGKVTATISTPVLNGLSVSSGASIDASRVDAGDFVLDASSGGSVMVTGDCEDLNADVSSGGSIKASELKCRTATVDASSGGSARVFANEKVSADASSGGSVRIYGDPQERSTDTSSGGSVRFR